MNAPRIGVTGMWSNRVHGLRFDGSAVSAAVLRAVVRAGGEPITLFAESALTPVERLAGLDGLLVPGGADIDPARYGSRADAATVPADFPAQDQFEADMMAAALKIGVPVLAICRGFQLLNVEHGGTLVQDLPPGSPHRNDVHPVELDPDSALAGVLGASTMTVSSYHHQAIARLGEGVREVGRAPDGIVEAIEVPGRELIAVQWHPEDTAASDPQHQALFDWLVHRAAAYAEQPIQPRMLVIEHQANAGLGAITERLASHGARVEVCSADRATSIPESLTGYDGLVVLGGSMGPEDDSVAPWLPRVRGLLSEGVAYGVPTLGICLGAQLLAVARGGRVSEMSQGPEIGLGAVTFSDHGSAGGESDPLFGVLAGTTVPVVQWHYLEVAMLPPAARVLASSGECRNQVFSLGTAAWGLQFHPEATAATAAEWVLEDAENLRRLDRDPADIVAGVAAAETELTRVWGDVAERFARVVDERARVQATA